jgi:hypothetical protein
VVLVDITGYVEHLRADLVAVAASGGDAMVDAAERLATSLDAAIRMALLEALSDAAGEITAALDGTTVEVRLRGRDPDLVVTVHEPTPAAGASAPFPGAALPPPTAPAADEPDDDVVARITLRIPESLKQRAEAAATSVRQSLNTWLVDAVRAAADGEPPPSRHTGRRVGTQLSGWAR